MADAQIKNKKHVMGADGGKEVKEKLPRYHKSVALGFKTPREATEDAYMDKKWLFNGNVSIRGRILSGVVTKMKMQRTTVIRRNYLHCIRRYIRFEKRHKNISVQTSPCFRDVTVGDIPPIPNGCLTDSLTQALSPYRPRTNSISSMERANPRGRAKTRAKGKNWNWS